MLSADQIQRLFRFCEEHYVYYYEVQVELVDHLANAIEAEMEANKKISFEQALHKVFSGFGIMGFAPVVREKTAQVQRRTRRLYWRLFVQQFNWPQVLRFLVSFAIAYTILNLNVTAGLLLVTVMVLILGIAGIRTSNQVAKKIRASGKKFLLLANGSHGLFSIIPFVWFLNFYVNFWMRRESLSSQVWPLALFAGFAVVNYFVTKKMDETLAHQLTADYPDLFEETFKKKYA